MKSIFSCLCLTSAHAASLLQAEGALFQQVTAGLDGRAFLSPVYLSAVSNCSVNGGLKDSVAHTHPVCKCKHQAVVLVNGGAQTRAFRSCFMCIKTQWHNPLCCSTLNETPQQLWLDWHLIQWSPDLHWESVSFRGDRVFHFRSPQGPLGRPGCVSLVNQFLSKGKFLI